MTRLLVSVRSGDEARAALAGGSDLIDVKEPSRGSLGAADPAVWEEVSEVVCGRTPTSVALGELIDGGYPTRSDKLSGFNFVKIGLAGCGPVVGWPRRWREFVSRLPADTTPVAVVYADWRTARAPDPDTVIEHAGRLGCGAVLFDTFEKTRGDLLDHLELQELERLSILVRRHASLVVLAGALHAGSLPNVLQLRPDYVAVRGAVCRHGRSGHVDPSLVRELARLVHRDDEVDAAGSAANSGRFSWRA